MSIKKAVVGLPEKKPIEPETQNSRPGANVDIPPNTDMNSVDDSFEDKRIEDEEKLKRSIPDRVIDQLPPMAKAFVLVFATAAEQAIALVSYLGGVSAILYNCVGRYAGKALKPNIFCIIGGAFGSGKSLATWAYWLLMPIHDLMRNATEILRDEYEVKKEKYEKALAIYKNKTSKDDEPPVKPKKPGNRMLFVPGNITKPALLKILNDNQQGLCIFEAEGDSVTDSQKMEHGNTTDIYRKSFHNESSSSARSTDDVQIEVKKTVLSAVLLMTLDQIVRMMKSIENGLFSRILYYWVPTNYEFLNVFDERQDDYEKKVGLLSKDYMNLYTTLSAREEDNPIVFSLAKNQKEKFMSIFQELKTDYMENVGEDSAGIVHRLAVMVYKIAFCLTIIRRFGEGTLEDQVCCTDEDFDTATLLVSALQKHALFIYNKMPKPKQPDQEGNDKENEMKGKLALRQQARDLRDRGFSYREISMKLFDGDPKKKSCIFRWLN